MADTQRLLSTLQTLLGDNTTGDISAQDMRDVLLSLAPNYGHLAVTSSTATTVASSGTYYEAAGTFALGEAYNFTKAADDRLRHDGVTSRIALVVISGTITCASSSQALRVAIGKNGVAVGGGEQELFVGTTGTDEVPFCAAALVVLATNDYVGILVRNDTGANNVTVTQGSILAVALLK